MNKGSGRVAIKITKCSVDDNYFLVVELSQISCREISLLLWKLLIRMG